MKNMLWGQNRAKNNTQMACRVQRIRDNKAVVAVFLNSSSKTENSIMRTLQSLHRCFQMIKQTLKSLVKHKGSIYCDSLMQKFHLFRTLSR